jgi:hypothetical protein
MSWLLIVTPIYKFTNLNNRLWLESGVSRTALGIQELQQLLKRFSVSAVVKERAFATDAHEIFRSELVKMMGQGGVWNVQLLLNLAHNQPFGVRRQKQLHDPKSGFGPYR